MYCSLIEDSKVFLSKLNKLIASLDDSEFKEVLTLKTVLDLRRNTVSLCDF